MRRTIAFIIGGISVALFCVFGHRLDSPESHKFGAGPGYTFCGGKQFFGQGLTPANWCFEKVHVPASTPTVLYTFPTPIANEQHTYSAVVDMRVDELDASISLDGGTAMATVRRYATGALVGGAFCTSQALCASGTSTAIDDTQDSAKFAPGGVLTGCGPTLVWNGTALELLAPSCPVGWVASGWATGFHSKDLNGVDAGPPSPAVLSVDKPLLATTYSGSTSIAITTTAGAATGVTAATYKGVSLTGCSAGTSSLVNCTLPAGTYGAGTGNVTVSSPSSPTACVNCATFVQSAVSSISPTSGPAGGSTAVTITLNVGGLNGCATAPTLDTVSCTSCAVVNDQTITCTSAAGSAGTGDVVVTSPSSPTALTNGWTYNPSVTVTSVCPMMVLAAATPVTIHGTLFSGGMVPTLGGVNMTSVVVVSSTVITAVTPASTPTVAGVTASDVVVSGSATSSASKVSTLPSATQWAYVPCPDTYTIAATATLNDLTVTSNDQLQMSSAGRQPAFATLGCANCGLSYVVASNSELQRGAGPPSITAPYSLVFAAAIPSWSTGMGFMSSDTNNGASVFEGISGHSTSQFCCGDSTGGTVCDMSAPHVAGWPGNFFACIINGGSSDLFVDGTSTSPTITGTPGGTIGTGMILGNFGGFPGTETLGAVAATNTALSTADRTAFQWDFHTAYSGGGNFTYP